MVTAQWSRPILLGAVIALSAGIAAGGVGDLSCVETVPPGVPVDGAQVAVYPCANPTAIGLTHPKAMVTADDAFAKVAFDADDPKADTLNVARIDMTGKGDFTDAVTVKLTKAPAARGGDATLTFPPRPMMITKGGMKIPALVSGTYYKTKTRVLGHVAAQAIGEGECRFGDTVRKVLVVDENRNLKLGDVVITKHDDGEYRWADYCRVANAKGKFVTNSRVGTVRIGQPIQVEGNWYTLTGDKTKITAAPLPGGVGTLTINAPRWECILTGNGYTLNITGGAEPVRVPAGIYQVRRFRLYRQADPAARGPNIYGSRSSPLTITTGKTASLSLGSRLTATMGAAVSTDKKTKQLKVQFSVSQADAAGSRIRGLYGADGKRPPAPQIEVVDKAGKVIYTAKLAYG